MEPEISQLILEELREFRRDTNSRLMSLEESRSQGRGILKLLFSSGIVAAIVSWFTGNIHTH